MPYIHLRAYSGKDDELKKKTAQAIIKAAHEATGSPESAFTLTWEDVNPEEWDKKIVEETIEPIRHLLIIENGKLV